MGDPRIPSSAPQTYTAGATTADDVEIQPEHQPKQEEPGAGGDPQVHAKNTEAMKRAGVESKRWLDTSAQYVKQELGNKLSEKAAGGAAKSQETPARHTSTAAHRASSNAASLAAFGHVGVQARTGPALPRYARDLKDNANFKQLDPAIKKQVLDMMDQFPIELDTDTVKDINVDQARDNLRQLATDPDFAKLSPEAQKLALENLAKRPDSKATLNSVQEGVKTGLQLESNLNFKRLDPAVKKEILSLAGQQGLNAGLRQQLVKLATTPDLKDSSAASALAAGLPYQKMKELWSTPGGEKLMRSLEAQMKSLGPAGQNQAARIESSRRASLLEASSEFGKLSDPAKAAVRDALDKVQTSPDTTGNIAVLVYAGDLGSMSNGVQKQILDTLVKNADTAAGKSVFDLVMGTSFASLGENTQKMLVSAMAANGADPAFAKSLTDLAVDYKFKNLGDTARASVVADLQKFTTTASYIRMSPTDREEAVKIIGRLAVHSAANPSFTVARNTLNHLLNGSVPMGIYRDKNESELGMAHKGVMNFNVASPMIAVIDDDLVTTATHEVNHVLNGETPPGTANRFLSEYRAWYVEQAALGQNPPSVDHMKEVLRNLATNAPGGSAYDHLRKLYRENDEFRKVVDQVAADLNATPPRITTPEQLREKLKDFPRQDYGVGGGAGDSRDLYLNTPGNDDNR